MECTLELDSAAVCRICLEPQTNLLSIFTKHIIDGNIRSLPEIILYCFSIDVLANSVFPTNICENCKTSVIQFFKFKENVIRSERLLANLFATNVLVKSEEPIYGYEITELQADKSIIETVYADDQFVDGSVKFEDIDEIMSNEVQDTQESEVVEGYKEEPLQEWDENFSNLEFIEDEISAVDTVDVLNEESYNLTLTDEYNLEEEHVQESVADDNYKEFEMPQKRKIYQIKASDKASALFCKICNKRISSDDDDHSRIHEYYTPIVSGETFIECFRCGVIFTSVSEVQTHLHVTHEDPNVSEEHLIHELPIVEDDPSRSSWTCGVCSHKFSVFLELKMHMVTHLTKIGCPFSNCGFEYTNFHHFYQHVRRIHLLTKFLQCKYCKKDDIPDFRSLQNHYRAECLEKKYKCEYCNRAFFTEKSYEIHVDIRHIEKKYICELCGKSFAQITELRIHTRMHTGERPFECTICKKAYKTASGRASHMDSHSNKVFPCDVCGKSMNSRRNLVTHVRRHNEEKRIKCEICGKRFFTKWHLNLHASKIHNNIY